MTIHTTLLCALFVLPLAWAQFPAVCNTEDSLSTKTCCPDNCGTHGTCVNIREEVEQMWDSANATLVQILHGLPGWPQDLRYQWPLAIFEWVCSCNEGWGGYDCSQCDFGYIANKAECLKRNANQLLARRNFKFLSEQERLNLIRLLEAAKNEEEKKWAAISSVPEEPNGHYILQNVSTYDMMVSTHALTATEKQSPYCPLLVSPNASEFSNTIIFGHFGPLFLPWHRYYIWQFESELRRIGEGMGIRDFTLPYWDWTPTSSCLMFSHELFGTPEYSNEPVNVSGTLFENGKWPPICDLMYSKRYAAETLKQDSEKESVTSRNISSDAKCAQAKTVCDVEGDRMANRRLQRGVWSDGMRGLQLPDYKLIALTLNQDTFEGTFGFENRLEGHLEQCAGETVKCMHEVDGGLNLHGIVHMFMGGQMSVGGPSPNDPVFLLHHANVDRIYEGWLQKYNGTPPAYQPISGGPPGHNLNDYVIPLFPLKKIADFYKESTELGYIYDELPWSIPSTDYQMGCPSEQCIKGGYPPTVLVNYTSAYCTRLRMSQTTTGGAA